MTSQIFNCFDIVPGREAIDGYPELASPSSRLLRDAGIRPVDFLKERSVETVEAYQVAAAPFIGSDHHLRLPSFQGFSGLVHEAGGKVGDVAVDDHGPGIPSDERERIFEMFHRLDASDSREVYGYGLGLPMVRRLLEAMGGGIKVEDSKRGGARFIFWLPGVNESDGA